MHTDAFRRSEMGVIRKNLANLITLGRIPLCFASFACAIFVLQGSNISYFWGFLGQILLILTALTDWFDGLVARKLKIVTKIGPLSDQMMDKMVYCIIFPTLAVGIMAKGESHMNHVVLSLCLCVTLLVRDHYVNFLRTIADRHNADSGVKRVGKLRTLWALPTSCVMYAYCFSAGEYSDFYYLNSILVLFQEKDMFIVVIVLEISLFVINIVSAISYTKIYGPYLMDEICDGDEVVRKKILHIFPNLLTLMNAIMGVIAMILAWNERYHLSFVLILIAAIFDKLDGAAARKLGLIDEAPNDGERHITLGMIFDDMADFISFCLAPAVIAHAFLREVAYVEYIYIYTILGMARLIYFTFDKSPMKGFFKGMPSPAAALMVGGVVHIAARFDAANSHSTFFVLGIFTVSAIIMNAYMIKYVHFGRMMSNNRWLSRFIFTTILLSIFSKTFLGIIASGFMITYLFSPLFLKPPESQVS